MLIAPAGKPTSPASSAIRSTLSGVCGSGFRTTEQPAALVRRRPAPGPVECPPGRLDGTVDVLLAGHRGAPDRLTGRRLDQLAELARRGVGALTVDEEPVLMSRRDGHGGTISVDRG